MSKVSPSQQAIGMAMANVVGALALLEGHEPSWSNVHSAAVSGLLIGLNIGTKDVHAAKMVTLALDMEALRPYVDSVTVEIMGVVEREHSSA